MAIDQTSPASPPDQKEAAAIDNELPAYRAISPGAVLSLVLGISSVFCFTDLWFLLVVGLSIAIGVLSIRKIGRIPDVLTGAAYARAGIAVALAFGLAALTHEVSADFLVKRDASRFARIYTEVLKSQSVNSALWYQQPSDYRKTKKPDEIAEELKRSMSAGSPQMFGERVAPLNQIKERLAGKGEEIHFARIESKVLDGLTIYANALLEFDGPNSEEFALVEMTKPPGGGPNDWMVKDVRYPYKPASAVATVVKADDGHGHSH